MTSRVGDYLLLETIGTGAFGKVRHAVHEDSGKHYAIKIMDKSLIRNKELTLNVRREVAIMKAFHHPNIVSLHHVLTSPTKLYIVLDLVKGPELFEVIAKSGAGGLPEHEARRYFQHLIDGVDYCHRRGVCHRDLKPENLLVDETGNLKITDFGMSSMKGAYTTTDLLTTQCGTPNYIAPEIISCADPLYDGQKVDAWACGVILFALLAGYLPFDETDLGHLFDVIQNGRVEFPNWFSAGARDLVWRLLCVDPQTRTSVQDVKRHPWFLVNYVPSVTNSHTESRPKRRRRRSRAAKSMDQIGFDDPPKHISHPENVSKPQGELPQSEGLPIELPELKIPSFARARGTSTTDLAAAAVRTARQEMMRSGRAMSFSKKYTLLRKGVINYGGLAVNGGSFKGPHTLGGEQEARMRGVLSVCNSDPEAPQSGPDCAWSSGGGVRENDKGVRNSGGQEADATSDHKTVQAIRSLQTVIAVSKSRLQAEAETNSTNLPYDAGLHEETLSALRKLRVELQSVQNGLAAKAEPGDYSGRTMSSETMSLSQRRETVRLLNVWEARMLCDNSTERAKEGTVLSEDEILSFQVLLRKWETQLAGEELVEDLIIPGSETVDDELPTTDVPQDLLAKHDQLRELRYRRRAVEETRDDHNNRDSAGVASDQTTQKPTAWPAGHGGIPSGQNGIKLELPSEDCGQLTDLWNHVLISNTSQLTSSEAADGTANEGRQLAVHTAEEKAPCPRLSDLNSSPMSTEVDQFSLERDVDEPGQMDKRSHAELSAQPSGGRYESFSILSTVRHPAHQSADLAYPGRPQRDSRRTLSHLAKKASQSDRKHPRLVRTPAQRKICTDLAPDWPSIENKSDRLVGNKDPRNKHGLRPRSKLTSRSSRLPAESGGGREEGFFARRCKLRASRTRFNGHFESAYDSRTCLREMEKLMKKRGVQVSRRHGSKALRVTLSGPRKQDAIVVTFEFQGKGRNGCAVHCRKYGGSHSLTRTQETELLSGFFDDVVDSLRQSQPGVAVLDMKQ